MDSSANHRTRSFSVTAAVVAAFAVWVAAFVYRTSFILPSGERGFCLFDDAMISMRYALNLVQGAGAVWNAGERVEGFTNPLQVGLMALALGLLPKVYAVFAMQLLGAAEVALILWLTLRLQTRVAQATSSFVVSSNRTLLLLLTIGLYPLWYWCLMGMETGLVSACLLLCLCSALEIGHQRDAIPHADLPNRRASLALLALGSIGLYLARPDAALFAVLAFTYVALTLRRSAVSPLLLVGGALGLVIGVHLLVRHAYYGQWTPNTSVLKLGGFALGDRLVSGAGYLSRFARTAWPLVLVAGYVVWRNNALATRLMFAPFAVAAAYQLSVGGDPWAYWRILAPTLPCLAILTVEAARDLTTVLRPSWRVLASGALVVAVLGVLDRPFAKEILGVSKPYTAPENAEHVLGALFLRQVTLPDATIGVTWAGAIPFFSDRYSIDFLGKCDPVIARLPPDTSGNVAWGGMRSVPGHNKYDLHYSIVTREPTFVQNTCWGKDNVTHWVADNYVRVAYRGQELLLRENSASVDWRAVELLGGVVSKLPPGTPCR